MYVAFFLITKSVFDSLTWVQMCWYSISTHCLATTIVTLSEPTSTTTFTVLPIPTINFELRQSPLVSNFGNQFQAPTITSMIIPVTTFAWTTSTTNFAPLMTTFRRPTPLTPFTRPTTTTDYGLQHPSLTTTFAQPIDLMINFQLDNHF